MHQSLIGSVRVAFQLNSSRNHRQERGVFIGRKTDLKRGRREVSLKNGAISERLGQGGAMKQRLRATEHWAALDR